LATVAPSTATAALPRRTAELAASLALVAALVAAVELAALLILFLPTTSADLLLVLRAHRGAAAPSTDGVVPVRNTARLVVSQLSENARKARSQIPRQLVVLTI